MKRPIRILKYDKSATDAALDPRATCAGRSAAGSQRVEAEGSFLRRAKPFFLRTLKFPFPKQALAVGWRRGASRLAIALVCFFQPEGRSEEPVLAEPSPSWVTQSFLSFRPVAARSAPEILEQRLAYYATNYFTLQNLIGPLQEELEQRAISAQVLGKPMANVLKRAGREAVREIALRGMRVDDLLETFFPDQVRGAIFYSLLDRADIGKLRDPFNPSEGVPGLERNEPGRFPRHSNLQLHPFRMDPSIDATMHSSAVDLGVRASVKEARVFAEIPLTASWVLTQGIKCEDYDHRMIYASFGVSKVIKDGYFTAGIRLPVIAHASPENQLQFIVAFQKRF